MHQLRTIAGAIAVLFAFAVLAACDDGDPGSPAAFTEPGETIEASAAALEGTD